MAARRRRRGTHRRTARRLRGHAGPAASPRRRRRACGEGRARGRADASDVTRAGVPPPVESRAAEPRGLGGRLPEAGGGACGGEAHEEGGELVEEGRGAFSMMISAFLAGLQDPSSRRQYGTIFDVRLALGWKDKEYAPGSTHLDGASQVRRTATLKRPQGRLCHYHIIDIICSCFISHVSFPMQQRLFAIQSHSMSPCLWLSVPLITFSTVSHCCCHRTLLAVCTLTRRPSVRQS